MVVLPELSSGVRAALKSLPAVDDLLKAFPPADYNLPRQTVVRLIRTEIDGLRHKLRTGDVAPANTDYLAQRISTGLDRLSQPHIRQVINGTGVVLHTGLGRAPLSADLLQRTLARLSGYTSLEFDVSSGQRGERLAAVSQLLADLTGAEAGVVVNNNAGAVLLMLNAVAQAKEVIVSRGQQVEIGGSFRIPDVISKSQARMEAVGTTNRTHLKDFEQAITADTGAILFVHPSNFKVLGFTNFPGIPELAQLAHDHDLPLLVDLGSGSLLKQPVIGADEPTVAEVLAASADVVTFSGDKLIGGPQSGILVGSQHWMDTIHTCQLYRALRCDKLILSILEEVLKTYRTDVDFTGDNLSLTLLNRDRDQMRAQADAILAAISALFKAETNLTVVDTLVEAGSGSLPGVQLPSLAFNFAASSISNHQLALKFRQCEPPVIGYIHKDSYYIDLKAVPESSNTDLARAIIEVLTSTR